MKQPRDYQNNCHTSTWNYLHGTTAQGAITIGKRPLIVAATGLGKSMNIAMLMWHLKVTYPGVKIMQLCHVKELVESNYEELVDMWPLAPAGVYAAQLGRREIDKDLTFAMINSVANMPDEFGKVDFVIIDEAHRLSDNDAGMYGRFINGLKAENPNLIVIGYTATDYRMKGGRLTDMDLFDDVVYDIGSGESFLWAVEQGYLIRPVPTDPGFKIDDKDIGITGGDFNNKQAADAWDEQDLLLRCVEYAIALAKKEGRKRALIFTQSIEHAELVAEMFTERGYPTEAVHSKKKREESLRKHRNGELWGITNQDILTTGYNDPALDLMVCLRLTRSVGLWVQMVGRMTRPLWVNHIGHNGGPPLHDISTFEGRWASINESGKLDARVLDFCGNTERLGPINYPNVPEPRNRKKVGGTPPVRTCNGATEEGRKKGMGCDPATFHHVSVKECPDCGYVFPTERKMKTSASSSELVSATNPMGLEIKPPPPKKFDVVSVHDLMMELNQGKDGKKNTVKATYRSDETSYREWLCFDHDKESYPYIKAKKWWLNHGGRKPAPASVDQALERQVELMLPKFIKVETSGRFPSVVDHDFVGHMFEKVEPVTLDFTRGGPPAPPPPPKIHEPTPDPRGVVDKEAEDRIAAMLKDVFDDDIPF